MLCPRYSTLSSKNLHLCNLRVTPSSPSNCSTATNSSRVFSCFRLKTINSLRYTRHDFHLTPQRMIYSARLKVAGALRSANRIHRCQNVPQCDVKVVLSRSSMPDGNLPVARHRFKGVEYGRITEAVQPVFYLRYWVTARNCSHV